MESTSFLPSLLYLRLRKPKVIETKLTVSDIEAALGQCWFSNFGPESYPTGFQNDCRFSLEFGDSY